jgi:hypothetical protein
MKTLTLLGVAAAVILATVTNASAATFKSIPNSCNDGEKGCVSFNIFGDIEWKDEEKFAAEINRYNTDTLKKAIVYLNSPGGNIHAAMAIGRIIRSNGWTTSTIPQGKAQDAMCVSACAAIWVAGKTLYAYANTPIGFHAAYYLNKVSNGKRTTETPEITAVGNALVGAYYNELGYSTDAIIAMTQADPKGMVWVKTDTFLKLGFKMKVLNG